MIRWFNPFTFFCRVHYREDLLLGFLKQARKNCYTSYFLSRWIEIWINTGLSKNVLNFVHILLLISNPLKILCLCMVTLQDYYKQILPRPWSFDKLAKNGRGCNSVSCKKLRLFYTVNTSLTSFSIEKKGPCTQNIEESILGHVSLIKSRVLRERKRQKITAIHLLHMCPLDWSLFLLNYHDQKLPHIIQWTKSIHQYFLSISWVLKSSKVNWGFDCVRPAPSTRVFL